MLIFFKPSPATSCAKEEDQESEKQSWFWKTLAPTSADDVVTNSEQCLDLAKELKRTKSSVKGNFHTSTKTDGERTSEQLDR